MDVVANSAIVYIMIMAIENTTYFVRLDFLFLRILSPVCSFDQIIVEGIYGLADLAIASLLV